MRDGDQVTFTYEGKELSGIVIQQKDGMVTVKLDTGYNLILPEGELGAIAAQPVQHKAAGKTKRQQDPTLPRVTILHTGGTIASKVDYTTGAVVAQFDPDDLLDMFPELSSIANIQSRLLRNMQSDDMRFAHYNLMARAVLEESNKGVRGVIITHGTDTLHYTSAALSFALEGLGIPVVLVGSQRSSDRGSSDAASNLKGALRFITEGKVPGVFVAMHETSGDDRIAILDGVHCRKNHTSRRDAFVPVNAPVLARVTDRVDVLDVQRVTALKRLAQAKPRVLPFNEKLKVGWWKAHPQSFADELLLYDHYDGLLLEGTGLGHIPMSGIDEFTEEHVRIRERVAQLAKRIPVAIASQVIHGRINLNVYQPQRTLQELGVLGDGCDMHPEVAFVKLAWLLSNFSKEDVRAKYGENLRGEITPRSPLEALHKEE